MFTKKRVAYLLFLLLALVVMGIVVSMRGAPETTAPAPALAPLESAPVSTITLKELAAIYWPDSNSTEVQRVETLKNLLGKRVTWEISVAEVLPQGDNAYLVQGQSDKNMLGTFSYVTPQNEGEKQQLMSVSREGKITLTGIVVEMKARHMVLNPARVVVR